MVKEITVQELKALMDEKKDFQLIDVREPYENEICTLNGLLIPIAYIENRMTEISKDKKVVIHCRSGARSAAAIMQLEQLHGFDNLYNLKGGILAWQEAFDPNMPVY